MRVLRYDVHLDEQVHKAGTAEADLPQGVKIPNPAAWHEPDEELADDSAGITEDIPTGDPGDNGDPDGQGGEDGSEGNEGQAPATGTIPSRSGPGSARAAWLSYAELHGVDVDIDANREEIIAALERAGVPTE